MLKKTLSAFAFAFALLFSNAFAQGEQLDVIYRDFPVTSDGFEEFMGCDGEGNSSSTAICYTAANLYQTCDKGGTPLRYGACNNGQDNNKRGYKNGPDALNCNGWEWDQPIRVTLGMVGNELVYDKNNCPKEDIMEDKDNLDRDFIKYRYCARPTPGNGRCGSDGDRITNWFSNSSEAKVIKDVIDLKKVDGKYLIEFDHNTFSNEWNDNGFFPLDKYDKLPLSEQNGSNDQTWGRESLNYWCPDWNGDICGAWRAQGGPKDRMAGRKTAQTKNVQNKLHNYGFSAAGSAEFKYNESEAHNDIFEFTGDDDMWIFVDGVLAADLGGVHLAAPSRINIGEYAKKTGPWASRGGEVWQNGTLHAINYFYMDRNTDGSNFKLKMAISNLTPSRFGAPRILKASTTLGEGDEPTKTIIWVNSELNIETLKKFIPSNYFPIVVSKSNKDGEIWAYKLATVDFSGADGSNGYMYTITGSVCTSKDKCDKDLNSGDWLSFNVCKDNILEAGTYSIPLEFEFPCSNGQSDWFVRSISGGGTPATSIAWGLNKTNLKSIVFTPEVADKSPVKPPFEMPAGGACTSASCKDNSVAPGSGGTVGTYDPNGAAGPIPDITMVWDSKKGKMVPISEVAGAGAGGDVHGFGTVGNPIPPQRAGELILTVLPVNENKDAYNKAINDKFFGLPPEASSNAGEWWGLADPTNSGGYQFVKNGFPNESSTKGTVKVAPTRCTTDKDQSGEPKVNCLNFSLLAYQPFKLAVTIYDQLGNFVTQYSETVSEQEFRYAVQAPGFLDENKGKINPSDECIEPDATATGAGAYGHPNTLTTNGVVKVNVNIYPFSKDGRRFGNGVYIAKIDRVDLPFTDSKDGGTCVAIGGTAAQRITPTFVRYHADQKFGWMRATVK